MERARSLLEVLQSAIERTYGLEPCVRDIDRYVVGDRGFARLYSTATVVTAVGAAGRSEAKVLVRETAVGIHANIYYPDALIEELEARNPLRGLDASNLDAFAVFVEELDHFLTLADRARAGRPVSLVELELHANVTKYVAARHFLERSVRRPLTAGELVWLRFSLFEKHEPPSGPPAVRARYEDADRLGRAYAVSLDRLEREARVRELRVFHRRSFPSTIRAIQAMSGG